MTIPARFGRAAQREFAKILRDLEHAAAADALARAVAESARLIGAHPYLGRVQPKLADRRYRLRSLSGFPYLMV